MKKIFRAVAALAVVMFAGCTNDLTNDVVAPVGEGTTVTIGLDTKTSLGELVDGSRKVYWSAGDQININSYTSKEAVIDAENKGLATFSFGQILNYPYSVLYPAEDYKDPSTITLPAVQAAASGSFGVDAAPMAAYVTAVDETPLLLHLTAVIRLQIKAAADGDTHEIYKVEFRGGGNEQVSGDFAIDYQTATLTATSTAVADQVVTARVNKSLSTDTATDVFIVVPAQEYAGFTVRVIDEYGHYMEKSSTATIELAKGQILAMPEFPFEPTGTDVNVEIKSAAELVAFAKAYNAGDYNDVRPLVIDVKNDIVFDDATNAEWEPIGGKLDGVDNYFDGKFNGNNFSVKNWNSTRPLFGYTSATGLIQDLTIDASCTLTANFADEEKNYGAFVGYHRGSLINCHVNANLTASGNWGNEEPHVGALVGRVVVGSVENCTVTGDVTITNTLVTNGEKSYYGGAVGRISNAAGVVKGVSVSGNVSHSAGSTFIAAGSTNPSDAYVYYGGIVGASAGTVTDCHLTDATKKFFYGNYVYNDGPTNQVENHYRNQYVGAIAGQVEKDATVSNCTNRAEVVFNQYNGSRNDSNDVSRYLNGGGIAGYVEGEVSNCTMYASLTNRSSCLQQYIGGVVGNVQATATISNCANEGASITAATTSLGYYQARNGNVGGVIGVSYSTALSQLSNKADLTCSRINSNKGSEWKMGGIIGWCNITGEIDGKNLITNSGNISNQHGSANNNYTAVGGIVGVSMASWKNVNNTGNVSFIPNSAEAHKNVYVGGIVGYATGNISLTSVTNEGNVYINGSKANVKDAALEKDEAYLCYNFCVGGILGTNADENAVTITSSTNSGTVAIDNMGKKRNGKSTAVGGIVGALTNGDSSISNCTNTGCISNENFNNTYNKFVIRANGGNPHAGGIAGFVSGAEDNRIEVNNCTSNKTEGNDSGLLYHPNSGVSGNRAVAGFIGTAQYADITNCNCSTYISNANSSPIAGFVVLMDNSKLDGCTLSNSTIMAGNAAVPATVGLVGSVTNSTISNNTIKNVTISTGKTAVLAGICDNASTFTDNKVSGTIDGTAITLSSTMIVSGTPTVTGTTLFTE